MKIKKELKVTVQNYVIFSRVTPPSPKHSNWEYNDFCFKVYSNFVCIKFCGSMKAINDRHGEGCGLWVGGGGGGGVVVDREEGRNIN